MFYTDEACNDLLNYSKFLVDQINKSKYCPQELRVLQYVIFAGMISYYGFEYVDTIYKAFADPNFYYTNSSLSEIMESNNIFDPSVENSIKNGDVGAFVLLRFGKNGLGKLYVNRDIYIIYTNDSNPDELLEKVVHEVNHVINSINNPICIKGGNEAVRSGLSIIGLVDAERSYNMLEESVNVLQSAEIVEHILAFTQCDVKNAEIKRLLDKIKYAYGSKREGLGYENVVPLIRPLYLNSEFNKVVKRQRMVGRIVPIKEHFERKVGDGSYNEFCKTLDELEVSSNSFWKSAFLDSKVKTYINRYNKSI